MGDSISLNEECGIKTATRVHSFAWGIPVRFTVVTSLHLPHVGHNALQVILSDHLASAIPTSQKCSSLLKLNQMLIVVFMQQPPKQHRSWNPETLQFRVSLYLTKWAPWFTNKFGCRTDICRRSYSSSTDSTSTSLPLIQNSAEYVRHKHKKHVLLSLIKHQNSGSTESAWRVLLFSIKRSIWPSADQVTTTAASAAYLWLCSSFPNPHHGWIGSTETRELQVTYRLTGLNVEIPPPIL